MLSKDYVDVTITKDADSRDTSKCLIGCIRLAKNYIHLCFIINRERKYLAKLTHSELQDIGLHPADVEAECQRSFFDVPDNRRKQYSEDAT